MSKTYSQNGALKYVESRFEAGVVSLVVSIRSVYVQKLSLLVTPGSWMKCLSTLKAIYINYGVPLIKMVTLLM